MSYLLQVSICTILFYLLYFFGVPKKDQPCIQSVLPFGIVIGLFVYSSIVHSCFSEAD
jgi:uncharacterized membrane protein YeiB